LAQVEVEAAAVVVAAAVASSAEFGADPETRPGCRPEADACSSFEGGHFARCRYCE